MTVTLKRTWNLPSGKAVNTNVSVPPGTYTVVRVANPYGYATDWLVLEGTTIGMCEAAWRQWTNDQTTDWEEFEIVFND